MSPQDHQHKEPLLGKRSQLTGISTAKDVPVEKALAIAEKSEKIDVDSPGTRINRELSWLSFARRVLALAEDPDLPLLERVKFAGIMGMLYDEFAMKRMGGLKRKIEKRKRNRFVRIKVPANRPRWVPLPDSAGFVPLEQVIASNLDLLFPMAASDSQLKQELEQTLQVYENDNCSAWDMQSDGKYAKRRPRKNQKRRTAQEVFIELIGKQSKN